MSADSFIPLAIAGAIFFAAPIVIAGLAVAGAAAVSYTHLRAHET